MEGGTLIIGIIVGALLLGGILAVLFMGFKENGWFRKKKELSVGPLTVNFDEEKGKGMMDQAKDAVNSAAEKVEELASES